MVVNMNNKNQPLNLLHSDHLYKKSIMKKLLLILICLFVSFTIIKADSIYDPYGKYLGNVDDKGRFFNPYGKLQSKITKEGSISSPSGKLLGNMETSGKIYDPYGRYKGQIESSGKMFDSNGGFKGTINR